MRHFNRNTDRIDKVSDEDIINYLQMHDRRIGGEGFLANMYDAVTQFGIKSLRENQRRGIEEIVAKEKFDRDNR